jgi:hypothetical protein
LNISGVRNGLDFRRTGYVGEVVTVQFLCVDVQCV